MPDLPEGVMGGTNMRANFSHFIKGNIMRKLIFLLLGFFIWQSALSTAQAQTLVSRGATSRVGTATTTVTVIFLGQGGEKDITFINLDSDTDTLIVYPTKRDTAASLWANRMLVLPGWTNSKLTRFMGDSIYVKSSNSTPFYMEATRR